MPITVSVDDQIAYIGERTWAASMTPTGARWPLLMEKAMAKMRGNYSHLKGGQPYRGIRFLRGGPWNSYDINDRHTGKGMAIDDIWETISTHLADDDLLTVGTLSTKDGTDTHKLASGMYGGHAYTIIRRKVLKDGTRIVVLRNPHGKDSYWGAESVDYDGDAWIKKLEPEIPEVANKDDGIIFVPVEQFAQDISDLYANYNASPMKFDYFLMTNDDVKTPSDIKKRINGIKSKMPLSMHKLTIVSPVAQKVWVTFTTWDSKAMPDQCSGGYGKNERHYIRSPDDSWHSHDPVRGGPFQFDPVSMQANSYEDMEIHFNVGDKSNPTDWSVVAWGETGPVYVYHNDGKKTAHWPTDPKHRKPASGKPATWDSTKPSPRDKGLTKAPKAKKQVAARAAKWWVDPKKKFFKGI